MIKKIQQTLDHIRRVQDGCVVIAKAWIEQGKVKDARILIQRSLSHDSTKFSSENEFYALVLQASHKDTLPNVIKEHQSRNAHHPEFWISIHDMPLIDLAEMVADWHARCIEMDRSLIDWINIDAPKRFEYDKSDPIYFQILDIYNILIQKPYEN